MNETPTLLRCNTYPVDFTPLKLISNYIEQLDIAVII